MNKMIVGALALGVVVVLGGWWYTSNQQAMKDKAMMEEKAMAEKVAMEKKEEVMKQPEAMMEKKAETMVKEDAMMKQDNAMMVKGGQYVSYDASKIAFAKDGKVVLFFRASWCPTCRALDANIKANLSQIPQNTLVLDVDYDKYTDLKKQYGVTYQHTLVQVDAMGKMIAKWSGSEGLSELLTQVK
ncbi:MAG: thioredoxin family protein [Candidatus Moraniibacteriota bacterium]|nr:MAG: thioredoxin family protein [Candidatus Moranbacteria bacterium]